MQPNTRFRTLLSAALLAGGVLAGLLPARADAPAVPPHLLRAESLVATILPANNIYGSPVLVQWAGEDGPVSTNRSVCSNFLTAVLRRAYGWSATYVKTWTGSTSPSAELYHTLIVAQNRFSRVLPVGALRAGDIIAVDYRHDPTIDSTGHVAMVSSAPIDGGIVSINGMPLRRYDVWVIDSSRSYHGKKDSRYLRPDPNGPDNGAGEGVMRIYADPITDEVAGYTWSDVNNSLVLPQAPEDPAQPGRHLALGRL
jgi:hypothetical protein